MRPGNKILENVIRTPGRQPSPQPTHLGVPGVSMSTSRILDEAGPGYIAPKFEGKKKQMESGGLQACLGHRGNVLIAWLQQ